jgi:hypothetical protein
MIFVPFYKNNSSLLKYNLKAYQKITCNIGQKIDIQYRNCCQISGRNVISLLLALNQCQIKFKTPGKIKTNSNSNKDQFNKNKRQKSKTKIKKAKISTSAGKESKIPFCLRYNTIVIPVICYHLEVRCSWSTSILNYAGVSRRRSCFVSVDKIYLSDSP